nr:MAG TPA: hypothetical protein [Caudoviricetes sp.]
MCILIDTVSIIYTLCLLIDILPIDKLNII